MRRGILIVLTVLLSTSYMMATQKTILERKKAEKGYVLTSDEEVSKKVVTVKMKGVIFDKKTQERLPGVTLVLSDNPSIGTVTNMDGEFQITAVQGSKLKVSYIGYETQLLAVNLDDNIKVELDQDNFKLDEVVVTGQGAEVQKRRLSSNVTTVNSKELERMKQGRIDQILQNSLPNVQITMASGQAGATSLVKSRGLSSAYSNSTPVIYVDGVRVDNMNTGATLNNSLSGNSAVTGSIGDIPMENIDHIEYVTGGAATTLYGSDAANGVIQIFTKKGTEQKISFFAETQLEADVASSQFYHFKRTKELLHQIGFTQKYRIGFDGGTEKYGYSFGANMSNSTGTLIKNGNEDRKYDLRFGSRVKFNKVLEYQNSFGMVIQDFARSRNGNQGGYTGLWFTEGAAATNFKYTNTEGKQVNYGADLDATTDYMPHKLISNVEQIKNLPLQIKANRILISPMNEVVKWPAGNFIEIELDNIYPAESIDINFGKKEPCTWGRFEISADGKEWKTIDLKQKDARLTAGLQKAPVKFVRFTNAGSNEQQVYLRQFVLSIEKK